MTRRIGESEVETVFAHLKTAYVQPGQVIRRGDVLGVVGKSYERRLNGRSVRLDRIDRKRF